MDRLLHFTLDKFIHRGALTVTTASGKRFTCGDGTIVTIAHLIETRAGLIDRRATADAGS